MCTCHAHIIDSITLNPIVSLKNYCNFLSLFLFLVPGIIFSAIGVMGFLPPTLLRSHYCYFVIIVGLFSHPRMGAFFKAHHLPVVQGCVSPSVPLSKHFSENPLTEVQRNIHLICTTLSLMFNIYYQDFIKCNSTGLC